MRKVNSIQSKEPPFVIVSWLDAWGAETAEATVSTAHEQHKAVPMETAGWLLFRNEQGVSVFCERCVEGKEFVYRGKTFIPQGMIVKVQEYKLSKPRKTKDENSIAVPDAGVTGQAQPSAEGHKKVGDGVDGDGGTTGHSGEVDRRG